MLDTSAPNRGMALHHQPWRRSRGIACSPLGAPSKAQRLGDTKCCVAGRVEQGK